MRTACVKRTTWPMIGGATVLDWSAKALSPDRNHTRRVDGGRECASRNHSCPHPRVLPA
jgi:hypothetical protein